MQKGVKTTRKTVTLEPTVLVNGKMGAGEKCANICRSLGSAPATVSIIMANAGKNKTVFTENYKIACMKCKLH